MTDHNTSGPKSPHPAPPEQQWGTPLNMHRTAIMREVFAIRAALFGLDMRFGSNQDMRELATELNWLIANDREWATRRPYQSNTRILDYDDTR